MHDRRAMVARQWLGALRMMRAWFPTSITRKDTQDAVEIGWRAGHGDEEARWEVVYLAGWALTGTAVRIATRLVRALGVEDDAHAAPDPDTRERLCNCAACQRRAARPTN